MNARNFRAASWSLVVVFIIATLQASLFPRMLPFGATVTALTLLPFVFALAHGSISYRFRDMLMFVAICFIVSNIFENLSILTGFPFGHYHYTGSLGPKILLVPVLISPAYLGTGYLSWTLARLILDEIDRRRHAAATFAVPILAAFIMVAWDLSFDPLASTIEQHWIWEQGGHYFGVPFSNFMGWFLTVYCFFQLFALYVRNRPSPTIGFLARERLYWLQAILLYAFTAVRIPLDALTRASNTTIADATGALWRADDIRVGCALVCLFTMFAFVFLGLAKLVEGRVRSSPFAS